MPKHISSLRQRLLIALLLLISLVWLGVTVKVYQDVHHEVEEVYDGTLSQTARLLLGLFEHEAGEYDFEDISESIMSTSQGHAYESKLSVRVTDRNGKLVLKTPGAPDTQVTAEEGFKTHYLGSGEVWRTYTISDQKTGLLIQTGQSIEAREEIVEYLMIRVLSSLIIALPILGVVIWWSVGQGLVPLQRVANQVREIRVDHLPRVDDREVPQEISVLTDSLNKLFSRLQEAMDKDRRFTADAAHELRTPLAALKTQVEVARRAADEKQKAIALEKILEGVDRATRLVEQLLVLARADVGVSEKVLENRVDLYRVAKETMADAAVVAMDKEITVSFEATGDNFIVSGEETMLGVMLNNVVNNALKYSQHGATVELEINRDRGDVVVEVHDSGPGISKDDLPTIFDRFRRGNTNGQSGSGLGLSIVKRICDLHQATVELSPSNRLGGLCVSIRFRKQL